jgi:indolepyruvate ferredoxin oxidoreductase beta subunit
MGQQIILSGLGGQGILFATRVLAEAALGEGQDVLTSETHGMAMRGATVVSHVKVGPFKSPLIRIGRADLGLFMDPDGLRIHGHYLCEAGRAFVNTGLPGDYQHIDAAHIAREIGSPVVSNLVLLGFAVRQGALFAEAEAFLEAIIRISPGRQLELNLEGFQAGWRGEG